MSIIRVNNGLDGQFITTSDDQNPTTFLTANGRFAYYASNTDAVAANNIYNTFFLVPGNTLLITNFEIVLYGVTNTASIAAIVTVNLYQYNSTATSGSCVTYSLGPPLAAALTPITLTIPANSSSVTVYGSNKLSVGTTPPPTGTTFAVVLTNSLTSSQGSVYVTSYDCIVS